MKTPTLEEVKEYFKDAESVQESWHSKKVFELDFSLVSKSVFDNWIQGDKNLYLWSKEFGYAKILSYKNEYKITKEQILSLHRQGHDLTKTQLNDLFPQCFKKELIVGVWYKNSTDSLLYCKNTEEDGCISGYGFNQFGQWVDDYVIIPEYTEAMPKEVEEALINYAKVLGYKGGVLIKSMVFDKNVSLIKGQYKSVDDDFYFIGEELKWNGFTIFSKGKWATILPTKKKMTISEIEEKLGFEIEIV